MRRIPVARTLDTVFFDHVHHLQVPSKNGFVVFEELHSEVSVSAMVSACVALVTLPQAKAHVLPVEDRSRSNDVGRRGSHHP